MLRRSTHKKIMQKNSWEGTPLPSESNSLDVCRHLHTGNDGNRENYTRAWVHLRPCESKRSPRMEARRRPTGHPWEERMVNGGGTRKRSSLWPTDAVSQGTCRCSPGSSQQHAKSRCFAAGLANGWKHWPQPQVTEAADIQDGSSSAVTQPSSSAVVPPPDHAAKNAWRRCENLGP